MDDIEREILGLPPAPALRSLLSTGPIRVIEVWGNGRLAAAWNHQLEFVRNWPALVTPELQEAAAEFVRSVNCPTERPGIQIYGKTRNHTPCFVWRYWKDDLWCTEPWP